MRKLALPTCNQALTMITQDAFTIGKMVINSILTKMDTLSKSRIRFIGEVLVLFLCLRGRCNFLQMSREGCRNEKSYRYQFEKKFDWLSFNIHLVQSHSSGEILIGFDPSFISKSGTKTSGIGNFYSGCKGSYAKGLELGGFAAIDVSQHLAYHLLAVQSPSAKRDRIDDSTTLVDHYASIFVEQAEQLKKLSNIAVFDAYFTKRKMVTAVCDQSGFEMIARMRDDANLNYLFKGVQSKGKGRPRKYDGKVDTKNIDKRRVRLVSATEEHNIYSAIVYSVGLDRNIRIAYVEHKLKDKIVTKIYFSTNLERMPTEILKYYRLRFQMEYLFRDAKQNMGLENTQARSHNKLNFHFNASLTAVSVAKVIARNGIEKNLRTSVSISDVKTECQNRNMIERIFSIYRFDRKLMKINKDYQKLINFGKIAA